MDILHKYPDPITAMVNREENHSVDNCADTHCLDCQSVDSVVYDQSAYTQSVDIKDTVKDTDKIAFKSNISEFWHKKYRQDLGKNWNLFYKRNETRFFRDRHWIPKEFPELLAGKLKLFEVGCGVGNFSFPLAELNKDLEVVGCDISGRAVELFMGNEGFDGERFKVFEADIINDDLKGMVGAGSVDYATSIFVLSALPPESLPKVIDNIWDTLKPTGSWFIRDYSSNDPAQHRFNPSQSQLEPKLFVRQDRTLAHYFDVKELVSLIVSRGKFEVTEEKEIRSRTRNVKTGLDLERSFIQLKFRKISQ